jgi:choline dehydrogenase-like flavoprotein
MTTQLPMIDSPRVAAKKTPKPSGIAKDTFGKELDLARALMSAVFPGGRLIGRADDSAVDRLARLLSSFNPRSPKQYKKLLRLLDGIALVKHKKRFTNLEDQERAELVWQLHEHGSLSRGLFMALTYPVKNAYFDDTDVYRSFGCVWEHPGSSEPPPAWRRQVMAASDLSPGEVLECDVVVVGTGAGGAVVAKELAERGIAVLLLEEGEYHTRKDFSKRSIPATQQLYRDGGITGVVGNCVIPIPMGRAVGGSTTINSGTCFRVPDWILSRWREEHGLVDFTPEHLAPHYEKVENILEIGPSSEKARGAPSQVIADGCDALGWSHFPVRRNAPGCDGQGVCQWGCPTDAKRSMNVSYVPLALQRGAQLVTGFKVQQVIVERGRAVGVRGSAAPDGKQLEVRAKAVILACGAMITPVLLLRNGIANKSGQVGRNLSVHPATSVSAVFDKPIRGYDHVPQGHGVDQFHEEGILMLGASAPLDMGATMFPFVGERYVDIMEQYANVCSFGVMVEDGPNGRILLGPGGKPYALYHLGKHERQLIAKGCAAVARIFKAAGARDIYTEITGFDHMQTEADIAKLESATPGGFDMMMVGFHPLGSCKMGPNPETSVVDEYHESHDVPGLYVVDGSSVPSSIAVNPQLTIMAMATRAAALMAPRFA